MRALTTAALMIVVTGSAWACPPNSRCIGERLSPDEIAARARAVMTWETEYDARQKAEAAQRAKSARRKGDGGAPRCPDAPEGKGVACAGIGF